MDTKTRVPFTALTFLHALHEFIVSTPPHPGMCRLNVVVMMTSSNLMNQSNAGIPHAKTMTRFVHAA